MKIIELIEKCASPFFSLEFFPPGDPAHLPAFFDTVDKLYKLGPLFASVTYGAGGKKQRNTLEITSELAKKAPPAMAHLTCVGAEPEPIAHFLDQLQAAGVDNVLALRGDPPQGEPVPASEFPFASDLVRFIRQTRPDMGIAVAAYPAPHPQSETFEKDRFYLAKKIAAGADFAITQLFFDPREYLALVEDLKSRGITAPVVPGILPVQSFEGLKRVLSLCGANIPARLYLALEKAQEEGGPEAMREAGLRMAIDTISQLLQWGAPGIHLYTLNKSELCTRILRATGLTTA